MILFKLPNKKTNNDYQSNSYQNKYLLTLALVRERISSNFSNIFLILLTLVSILTL